MPTMIFLSHAFCASFHSCELLKVEDEIYIYRVCDFIGILVHAETQSMPVIELQSSVLLNNFLLFPKRTNYYESPEGTWEFSKKAISKSLYRIVQSVITDK